MQSRELEKWPNGVEIRCYVVYPCGHRVPLFSNRKWPECMEGLKDVPCVKCEGGAESLTINGNINDPSKRDMEGVDNG